MGRYQRTLDFKPTVHRCSHVQRGHRRTKNPLNASPGLAPLSRHVCPLCMIVVSSAGDIGSRCTINQG